MAQSIEEKFIFDGGYVDNIRGPYADLNALKDIGSFRFKGLYVSVLSPVYMECCLMAGKTDKSWKLMKMATIDGYEKLVNVTTAITAVYPNLIAPGFKADVIVGGKPTTYVAVSNDGEGNVVWEEIKSDVEISEAGNNAITKKEDGIFAALYYETEDK